MAGAIGLVISALANTLKAHDPQSALALVPQLNPGGGAESKLPDPCHGGGQDSGQRLSADRRWTIVFIAAEDRIQVMNAQTS